jgi:hypothetical protein
MAKEWWENDPVATAAKGDQWWSNDPVVGKSGKEKERTFSESITDIGAGLKSGAGSLLQLPGQISGAVFGDYEKPGQETGLTAIGKEMQAEAQAMKSPGLKAREAERSAKISEAEKTGQINAFFTAFSETAKDPGLLLNFMAEQAPQLIPALGAARLIKPIAGTAAAVRGAVGTGAVQQGADIAAGTYEQMYQTLVDKGVSETEAAGTALGYARATGASAAAISLLAQRLPGARAIEEAFAGQEGKLGRILGGVRGGAGEALSETAEETGGKFAQNVAQRQVDPNVELTSGLGEVAGMAALGGLGLGSATGLAQRQAGKQEAAPEEKQMPSQFAAEGEPERTRPLMIEFKEPPPKITDAEVPALLTGTEEITPVSLPDNTVALTKTDLIEYTKEQGVETGLTEEQVDALRTRAEAPPTVEGEYISQPMIDGEYVSDLSEKDQLKKDLDLLSEEAAELLKGRPFESIFTALRGRLVASELSELGEPSRFFGLRASKNVRGYTISDLIADGYLDIWLPPEYRKGSMEGEMQMDPDAALSRALDSEEFIKKLLAAGPANGNYLTYDTKEQLRQIGQDISNLQDAYKEYVDEDTFDSLVQEAVDEQRRIYEDYTAAIPETEVGSIEPPQRVFEQPSEEQIAGDQPIAVDQTESTNAIPEDEYFPDREEFIRGKQDGSGTLQEEFKPYVINKNAEEESIEKQVTGKTMLGVAQWAVDNAPNKFAKAIAQKVLNRLNGMAKRGIKLDFEVVGGESRPKSMKSARGQTTFGFFDARENKPAFIKVTLNGAAVVDDQPGYPPGTRYITILHELVHAATVGQTQVLRSDDPIIKELQTLHNAAVKYYNAEVKAGRMTPFMQRYYKGEINILDNADELLAWGLADKDMQEFLSNIKIGDTTIFSELVDLVRRILNITKPYQTALDELIRTAEVILDEKIEILADKITAKQYSFGVNPKQGESIQGTLFQQEGAPKKTVGQKAKEAAQKVAKKAAGQRQLDEEGFEGITPDMMELVKKHFFAEKKTIVDKVEGLQQDFWMKMAQGVADQYRSIKEYTQEGYMLARLSKTVDGALEGMLFNGHVKLTDGALDIKQGTKGLMQVMEPIGKEVDRYMIWVALSRDAQLRSQGKQGSISPELVSKRKQFVAGTLNGKSRLEVYEQVQKDMNALNRSVLDIALKQGIIDRVAYKKFSQDINYIPFYKEMENGDIQGAATASGLANQYFSKQLEGGEKAFGDLMENTLRNWSHILSAAMKNEAVNKTIDAAMQPKYKAAFPILKSGLSWEDGKVIATKRLEQIARVENNDTLTDAQKKARINDIMKPYIDAVMERNISNQEKQTLIKGLEDGLAGGDGKLRPEYTTSKPGAVKTMREGQPIYFDVSQDPLLFESIMSIGYLGPKSKFLDVARDFKNILQAGVTLSPAFKVRNLIRDSVQSAAVSPIGLNIAGNVIQGINLTKKDNPDYISALAGGGIFNFGSSVEGDQAKLINRLIKSGVDSNNIWNTEAKITAGMSKAWKAYQDWGNKSEAANRMALYKQLRDKGLSHLEASFQARDLLDFSMQGSWPALRLVTQVVPFLNARIQGLYKLGRDGIIPTSRVLYNSVTGKESEATDKEKAQQFSVVTSAVVLASLMLYMAFKDDDDFKKREQWDRDNFWWFKLPGMDAAVRIPKPFEIGAFGTLAERTAEQIFDQGAEGRVFEQSLKRMVTDTFAINPMPQMFKPLVDLYANKDSFTGAPIETAGMERLSKAERIATGTSPLAIALSKVSNVFLPESMETSPVQADYAIKAYFGWLGATISATSHYAVMPFAKGAYPDHNWTDTISMGFVKTLPSTQSGYVTSFYENMKIIEQSYADMRHYAEIGNSEKVQQIIEEQGDKIAMAKFYDKTSKDMSKIRQVISFIQNDETMSGAAKREEIDRLKILIGDLAKQAEDVRKSMRN